MKPIPERRIEMSPERMIIARAEAEFAFIRRLGRGEIALPHGKSVIETIASRAQLAEAQLASLRTERRLKPTIDDAGNWITTEFVLTRSAAGLSDRPVTAATERIAS